MQLGLPKFRSRFCTRFCWASTFLNLGSQLQGRDLFYVLLYKARISLSSRGWPSTHNFPASASRVSGGITGVHHHARLGRVLMWCVVGCERVCRNASCLLLLGLAFSLSASLHFIAQSKSPTRAQNRQGGSRECTLLKACPISHTGKAHLFSSQVHGYAAGPDPSRAMPFSPLFLRGEVSLGVPFVIAALLH